MKLTMRYILFSRPICIHKPKINNPQMEENTGYSNNDIFSVISKYEIMTRSYTYISFMIFLQPFTESTRYLISSSLYINKEGNIMQK